jgi:lysophospholipase L1-like esterase
MLRWVILVLSFAVGYAMIAQKATAAETKQDTPSASLPKPPKVACGPFTKANLPKSTPQSDQHGIERFQFINRAVTSAPYSILFLGDSLTEDWDPTIWQRHFAGRAALNAGIEGDRTEHLLWRLEHGNLDGPSPTGVVLLIGTNDVGRNRPAEMIAEGIRANLQVLRSRFPSASVLLLGLLPRGQSPDSPRRQQISQVNRLIRKCADGRHLFYAEIGDSLLDPGGRLSPEISPDGVHLSQRGYASLSSRLESELDRILPGGGR